MSDAVIDQATRPEDPMLRRRLTRIGAASLALVIAFYLAGPLVAVVRILGALDRGDTVALQTAIDWPAIREGFKEDVAEGVLGMPQQTLLASNTLPPFGAGFVSGIAATEIDRDVTPEALLEAARLVAPAAAPSGGPVWPGIVGVRVISPVTVDLRLHVPGQDVGEAPLHVRLAFQHGGWQVVRAWIPQDMADRAAAVN